MSENTDAAAAATLVDMSPPSTPGEAPEPTPPLSATEQDAVRELVRQARASGTSLTGPDGLLTQLTKMVVEATLDEELSDHLGLRQGAPARHRQDPDPRRAPRPEQHAQLTSASA